jgi:hypothetical protein
MAFAVRARSWGVALALASGCSLPTGAIVPTMDVGTPTMDVGTGTRDGGPQTDAWSNIDAGPGHDAYSPGNDAYVTPTDAPAGNDAYTPGNDAYVAPNDAYVAPNDAYVPPNDAYVASDAARSCSDRFGSVTNYALCSETSTTCVFVAHLRSQSCGDICSAGSMMCMAEQSPGITSACSAFNNGDVCTTQHSNSDHVCTCTM